MALALAESLRDRGVFDPEDIGARYLAWWREGAFDTGSTAGQVFELGVSGLTLDEAASRVDELAGGLTAGCNPAHRSAPLAMLAALEDARLPEAAKAEACLTHRHALAGDVAAAVVALCRALIRGMAWRDTLDVAASDRLAETRAALTDRRAEALSRGGFAPEVLRAAVSFVDPRRRFLPRWREPGTLPGPPTTVRCSSAAWAGRVGGATRLTSSSWRTIRACFQGCGQWLSISRAVGWRPAGITRAGGNERAHAKRWLRCGGNPRTPALRGGKAAGPFQGFTGRALISSFVPSPTTAWPWMRSKGTSWLRVG